MTTNSETIKTGLGNDPETREKEPLFQVVARANTIAEDDGGGGLRDRGGGGSGEGPSRFERNSSGSRRRKPHRTHEFDRTASSAAISSSGQSTPRESQSPSKQHFDMRSMSHELMRAEHPQPQQQQSQHPQSTKAEGVPGGGGSGGGDQKKERIRNLWGKMANKGMEQSEGASGGGKKKWDQLLMKGGGGAGGGGGGYNARHQQQVSSKFEAFRVTVKVENVTGEEGDPYVILIPFWPICIHDRTLFVGSL